MLLLVVVVVVVLLLLQALREQLSAAAAKEAALEDRATTEVLRLTACVEELKTAAAVSAHAYACCLLLEIPAYYDLGFRVWGLAASTAPAIWCILTL